MWVDGGGFRKNIKFQWTVVACQMNVSGSRGARILTRNVASGGRRRQDVFHLDMGDVFSHLAAN